MNRFLKKICTGILCGVLGVVSIGAQETFAADAKEMRAVWISTVYSADYPSTTNNAEAQKNEFIQKLEQAQALGLNTVVVQVRPKGGCAVSVRAESMECCADRGAGDKPRL